jgi:hypothetical protein
MTIGLAGISRLSDIKDLEIFGSRSARAPILLARRDFTASPEAPEE